MMLWHTWFFWSFCELVLVSLWSPTCGKFSTPWIDSLRHTIHSSFLILIFPLYFCFQFLSNSNKFPPPYHHYASLPLVSWAALVSLRLAHFPGIPYSSPFTTISRKVPSSFPLTHHMPAVRGFCLNLPQLFCCRSMVDKRLSSCLLYNVYVPLCLLLLCHPMHEPWHFFSLL